MPTFTKSITSTVVAGRAGPLGYGAVLAYTPPNPQPGPYGNHEYEVVVCDKYGVAFGVIPSAVPTQIDWELDDDGQALIDFWILDPQAVTLMPIESLPGVREIQIWRDQVLIFWGWPISATWDNAQVHLTCSSLLWPLAHREFGPGFIRFLVNPQFEMGLDNWAAVGCSAAVETVTVALGKQSARLFAAAGGEDAYLHQTVTIDLTGKTFGLAFALSAWVYLDGAYAYGGPALNQRGLYIEDNFGNVSFVSMPEDFAADTWTRIEVQPTDPDPAVIAEPGVVTVFDIRLYCPGGSVVWDDVLFSVFENVSSPPQSPPATAWDVADIIQAILESAQNPQWTKSDLAFEFIGAPTGIYLNRVYDVSTSEVILDAINEFPSIGVCDFAMVWDDTGHFRGMQIYSPAKGSIKYNAVIDIEVNATTQLGGSVDGSQVGTTWRVLGQGSTGPAEDTGFAAFASYLGGRVVSDGTYVAGVAEVESATAAFTAADVNEIIYSMADGFLPGTFITAIIDSTHVAISTEPTISVTNDTVGIGGITVDQSVAALPDQPISTLQGTAQGNLVQTMKALALPTPRMRADGPNGLFGLIDVGDIVFSSGSYGWLTYDPTMVRISKLSLYPPTEELEPTLMPLNTIVAP